MKRCTIPVLVLILILGLSLGSLASQVKDVPPSHWAYKAVQKVIDGGYMTLLSDNTFSGERPVTRYQLAEVVAKLLDKVGIGEIKLTGNDADLVKKLTIEFRNELVDIAGKQTEFGNRLTQVENNQVVLKEDIARSHQEILNLMEQLSILVKLETQLNDLKANSATKTEISTVQSQIGLVEKNMAEGLAFSVADLTKQIEDLKTKNTTDIQTLKDENAKLKEETAKIASEAAKLQEENKKLQESNTGMQEDIKKLENKQIWFIYALVGGLLVAILVK